MSNATPPPPNDTSERICPQCRSADLLALGRVLADNTGMIRSAYRCRECGKEFLLISTERRRGPERRRGSERRPGPDRRVGPRDRRANT